MPSPVTTRGGPGGGEGDELGLRLGFDEGLGFLDGLSDGFLDGLRDGLSDRLLDGLRDGLCLGLLLRRRRRGLRSGLLFLGRGLGLGLFLLRWGRRRRLGLWVFLLRGRRRWGWWRWWRLRLRVLLLRGRRRGRRRGWRRGWGCASSTTATGVPRAAPKVTSVQRPLIESLEEHRRQVERVVRAADTGIVDGGMDGLAIVADGERRATHGVGELLDRNGDDGVVAVTPFSTGGHRTEGFGQVVRIPDVSTIGHYPTFMGMNILDRQAVLAVTGELLAASVVGTRGEGWSQKREG